MRDPFSGPILVAIQAARIFPDDSKTFVDLSLLVPPDECWRRWEALPKPPCDEDLRRFVLCTFDARPGEGQLEPWQPPDYQWKPPLLARLPVGPVREWASALNQVSVACIKGLAGGRQLRSPDPDLDLDLDPTDVATSRAAALRGRGGRAGAAHDAADGERRDRAGRPLP